MQNRFLGDIGDFGKYGLLRIICKSGLKLGVNWYLTDDGIDSAGNLTEYLTDGYVGYETCDPALFKILKEIVCVDKDRTVARIEKSGLLPENTQYYSCLLKANRKYRQSWFQDSLVHLADCEIIFLDPDNNILANSKGTNYRSEGSKYTFPSEIEEYYRQGHSLVVYNHANRQSEQDYFRRFDFIRETPNLKKARILVMKYNRQQVRYYLLVLQPEHSVVIESYLNQMLDGPWGKLWKWDKPHFKKLELW
ncbi:MAG: hypothetical protein PHF24_10155 [Syntrophomonas sp.]|nr:hypothetical protein [Syntrophomonas sp.]